MKLFSKNFGRGACLLALAGTLAGCYSYQEPASATFGESYTERKRDKADEMLKGITNLTLRDAQRIAILNNPTYISAYHSMEAARMRYLQAWGAYSPTLNARFAMEDGRDWMLNYQQVPATGVTSKTPHQDAFVTDFSLTANILIFDGFVRTFKLLATKSEFNYYAKMEEDACRTMMLSVAYAYNTVLLAIENRRIATEDRKFQLSSLKNTQYKFEAGAAPLSDVLNFEIYVNTADVSLVAADYQYETAVYALACLMGYPDGILPSNVQFPVNFVDDFVDLPAIDIYLDAALANRPDLKAYREKLNVAKYLVYQAMGAYSPVVNGFLTWGYGTNATIHQNYAKDRDRNYWEDMSLSYGLTADWTVISGAIRMNKIREAKALRAVAEYEVAAQWFTVIQEVRTAYSNYVKSVKQARLYERIRSLSAKQRDLVDDEYKAGNAELTRLNEAQRDLVEAETNLASSYINVQNAKAQLAAVVGAMHADTYTSDKNPETIAPGLMKKEPPQDPKADQKKDGKKSKPDKGKDGKAAGEPENTPKDAVKPEPAVPGAVKPEVVNPVTGDDGKAIIPEVPVEKPVDKPDTAQVKTDTAKVEPIPEAAEIVKRAEEPAAAPAAAPEIPATATQSPANK